jgi:hypothetical protein
MNAEKMSKLQEELNNINLANQEFEEENNHLSGLIRELSNPIQNDENITIIQYYLTSNTEKMNSEARIIQEQLCSLDESLSSFVGVLSSLAGIEKNNSIGDEIRKVIESNISKNSFLNKLNSEIASLNKKLNKINNNSNKFKIKEKKMMIRRKNDELRELDMEKDAKISELQMFIEN